MEPSKVKGSLVRGVLTRARIKLKRSMLSAVAGKRERNNHFSMVRPTRMVHAGAQSGVPTRRKWRNFAEMMQRVMIYSAVGAFLYLAAGMMKASAGRVVQCDGGYP